MKTNPEEEATCTKPCCSWTLDDYLKSAPGWMPPAIKTKVHEVRKSQLKKAAKEALSNKSGSGNIKTLDAKTGEE